MTPPSSVLIVGAGIFGTSTAYHLSQLPNAPKITVLDRTPTPPAPAASTDINKIIRADYTEAFYCELAYEAMSAWSSWPEIAPYYHRTGWIMLDEEGSDLAERIRKVFRDRGHDPTEDVALSEIGERWGGILKGTQTKGFRDAYWNPEAGWCEASDAMAAMMKKAMERGVEYVCGDVEELVLGETGVKGVKTTDGKVLEADQIVLATGAWTSSIMTGLEDDLNIAEDDRVEKQAVAAGVAVAHYKMSAKEMKELEQMPVVVYGENGEAIPPPKENQLLKFTNAHTFSNTITTKTGHKISVPPNRDQHIVPKKLQKITEQLMTSRVMTQFTKDKPVDHWRLCWDCRTPTQDWLLDKHPHPALKNLYFAIGGSFHSYKFLPIAGKYMVNVLTGKGNGQEMDEAWAWKSSRTGGRGAHEKTEPRAELADYEDGPRAVL
ncbi:hypothetical protein M8818_003027 [Zalaria obscura]|uniref:Uncharacterized protein n=1 Tax=Zalaria obscura TaxID=2024903 RepID=A0ACC3SGR6_9PEZI